jgi:hypothetical protein
MMPLLLCRRCPFVLSKMPKSLVESGLLAPWLSQYARKSAYRSLAHSQSSASPAMHLVSCQASKHGLVRQ